MRLRPLAAAMLVALAGSQARSGDAATPQVTARVRVVTTDEKHDPIAGAKVVLRDHDADLATGRTDATGMATLSVRWNRGAVVEASGGGRGLALGYVAWAYEGGVGERRPATECTTEIALPPGAPLRGTVLDAETGRPVAGARACVAIEGPSARGFREALLARATAGADGVFAFEGLTPLDNAVGTNQIYVVAPGHVSVRRDLTQDAVLGRDAGAFRLDPAGTIRGRFLHRDGTPCAGGLVSMESELIWSPDGDRADSGAVGNGVLEAFAVRAADDGSFEFPGAAFGVAYAASTYERGGQGDHRIQLVCDDLARGMRVMREAPITDVVLRRSDEFADAPVSLYVGVRAASASVTVADASGALSPVGEDRDVVGAQGNPLAFRRVPPGRWRLTVQARNLPNWTGEVVIDAKASPSRAEAVIGGKETIEGRVVDDVGAPVVGARVQWHEFGVWTWPDGWPGDAGPTGTDGVFRVAGLSVGKYCLRTKRDGFGDGDEVRADAPSRGLVLVIPRTGAVRVRLEAPPGVAMPSSGWCEPGFPEIESTTMTVSGLPAGHRAFDVELRDNPYGATHLLPVHVDAVVKPGETSDLGAVRLDTGVAVSGVVVGADGRPIADASVSSGVAGTRSGANGGFTLSPLPRGRVTLLAKLDRLIAQTPVDASAPPGDFIVRLVRARILLADASALPKDRWFYVRAKAQGATAAAYPMRLPQMDHDARFGSVDARRVAALPLPPGDWTLEVVEEGDVVLATTHVTVPTDGDGPVRVWIPVK